MNNLKQFLVDSIANDFAEKLEQMTFDEQQTVTLKLAEMYLLFGEAQKAHDLVVTLRTAEAKLIEAKIYRAKGHVEQAAYTYFKTFADAQQPVVYEQLAALFDEAGFAEDAAYYAQLAQKLQAYQALHALAQDDSAREQATQMIAHPQSFDGWLQSVLRLNEEQLDRYADQAIAPIIEEKRSVRKSKPTLTVPAAAKPVEREEIISEPPVQLDSDEPVMTRPIQMAQPMMQVPVQQTEQPSPYVDPVAFIAAQQASQQQPVQKTQDDDLNDFESMYFGEMYDED